MRDKSRQFSALRESAMVKTTTLSLNEIVADLFGKGSWVDTWDHADDGSLTLRCHYGGRPDVFADVRVSPEEFRQRGCVVKITDQFKAYAGLMGYRKPEPQKPLQNLMKELYTKNMISADDRNSWFVRLLDNSDSTIACGTGDLDATTLSKLVDDVKR